MSVELVDDNGPLTTASRVYGRISPAGQPKSFSPNLIWDFIRTSADVRYALATDLSSLDDYVSAFALQKKASDNTKWDGQGLRATGFADGVASTDLATVGQLSAISAATGLTIASTTVTGGANGRVLYDNNGTLGEYQLSGTGKVLMDTSPVVAAALTVGTQQTTQGSIVFANTAAGAYPVTVQSSNSTSAAWTLTLPTTAGTSGQALTTNGSGVTTWTSIVTSPGGSSGQFQYNNSSAFGGANLYYESANLIAQRNSTTAQGKRIYNSYTDSSNGEWLSIDWTASANVASILTVKNGSGTQRALSLGASGAANWQITTSGHLMAVTDNTYDIGASGATRPRNLYVAGTGIFGGLLTTVATALAGAGLNVPHGTAPTSPNNGDVWTTTSGLFARINGSTVGPFAAATSPGGSTTQVQYNSSGSFAGAAGFTFDGTSVVTLGVAGTSVGGVAFKNATSGTITLQAVTGALGTVTLSLPATTTTLAGLGIAQSFTQLQTFSLGASIASGQTLNWNSDTYLNRDAANTLALRNTTNAQTFNVYNTYTDASNYEAAAITWSGGFFRIQTTKAGTGSNRAIILSSLSDLYVDNGSGNSTYFRTSSGSTTLWQMSSSAFLAGTDNTYDIGASGANRPRTGYFGTSVVTPLLNSTGAVQAYSGTAIPAGGTTGSGIKVSSTSNFGVFFGSGAPTLSAAKGSLYLRSDGSTTNDRAYINSDGSTTWTALTTAA